MLNDCSCGEPLFDYIETCPKCGATNPFCCKGDEAHKGRVFFQGIMDDVSGWFHRKHGDDSVHIYMHGPGK